MTGSVFTRYIVPDGEQPAKPEIPRGPLSQPVVPPASPQSSPAEQLLDFAVNRWAKPSISVRDILQFGPRSVRNRKSAVDLAEALAQAGWLAPIDAVRQHNMKHWRIVRGPSG